MKKTLFILFVSLSSLHVYADIDSATVFNNSPSSQVLQVGDLVSFNQFKSVYFPSPVTVLPGNDTIRVDEPGIYRVRFEVYADSTKDTDVVFAIDKNGTAELTAFASLKKNIDGTALVNEKIFDLEMNDVIRLRVVDNTKTSEVTIPAALGPNSHNTNATISFFKVNDLLE